MTATIDKVLTHGNAADRTIEDGSSASSSTSIPTINKVNSIANKRTGGVLTFNGSSLSSALSTSYSASVMTVTLTSAQADNQVFRVTSATSHSSISASDDIQFVFPAESTGGKFIQKSTNVSVSFKNGSGATTASIAKSTAVDAVLLVNSAAYAV